MALPLTEENALGAVDAAVRLTPAFRLGAEDLQIKDYLRQIPGGRKHRLETVRIVLDEVMARYPQENAAASDAWLGPRLHAALRLSRREAGSRDVWRFLGLWAADYVRWRFGPAPEETDPDEAARSERFIGPDYKHALARLWWMTELFRNGKDYSTASLALTNQDLINNLFRADAAHHRPTALAVLAVLPRSKDGKTLPHGRTANALSKAINAAASTLLLDVIAVDAPLDAAARRHWESKRDDHDPRVFFDALPDGPDDPPVPAEVLKKMTEVFTELLAEAHVRGQGHEVAR
jgi:hypothetical protein